MLKRIWSRFFSAPIMAVYGSKPKSVCRALKAPVAEKPRSSETCSVVVIVLRWPRMASVPVTATSPVVPSQEVDVKVMFSLCR